MTRSRHPRPAGDAGAGAAHATRPAPRFFGLTERATFLSRPNRFVVRCPGKLGRRRYRSGYYVYVGSARKNLGARIERHKRLRKNFHWHIDYLRAHAEVRAALPIRTQDPIECALAEAISAVSGQAIAGFGCTDCACDSHLFAFASDPLLNPAFVALVMHFRIDRLVD